MKLKGYENVIFFLKKKPKQSGSAESNFYLNSLLYIKIFLSNNINQEKTKKVFYNQL